MTTTLEILRQARELLSDESRWTKDTYARDVYGNPTMSTSDDAACFCVMGSLRRICRAESDNEPLVFESAQQLIKTAGLSHCLSCIPDFNDADNRPHSEVLDLFDRTIQRLEQGN